MKTVKTMKKNELFNTMVEDMAIVAVLGAMIVMMLL